MLEPTKFGQIMANKLVGGREKKGKPEDSEIL